LAWGQNCTADDGTDGIVLWGDCYSIENTIELDLSNSGLDGSIPPEIGNLTNLTKLKLYNNQLTGEIPPEIGNLTNLTYLYLYTNQLSGSIPSEIGNLTNLIYLYLYNNQLIGEIPSSIGHLNNLEFLLLDNNQLSGLIPENLCGIIYVNVGGNNLCPPYPECLSEEVVGYQDTSNCEQVSIIDETLPMAYNLYNAYPNPFNPVTTLRYDLPEDALVNITIYDMMGRIVSNLVSSQQNAGYKSIQWDATNVQGQPVSAGVYLYSIEAGEFRQTKKMVLLK
jgi:hypothetical protein